MRVHKLTQIFCLLTLISLLNACSLFKNLPPITQPEMVAVKGGYFLMGDVVEENNKDALPVHEVHLDDFLIGKYEVTYEQYDEFAHRTGRELPNDFGLGRGNRAVTDVTWDNARAYCEHLNLRLPTEVEWEYAARAGGRHTLYAGTSNPDSLSHYALSEFPYASKVGSKIPNSIGLYDMSGNVFEWIGEYYQFYSQPDNLHDLENSAVRIIRGGSFSGDARNNTKVFWRVGVLSYIKDNDIGFRCAKSASSAKP